MTSLQTRTAETPRAQRTLKTNRMDAWRSVRVRDLRWNPPPRTLRLSGDLPLFAAESRILLIIELLQRAPDGIALTAEMTIFHIVVVVLATTAFVAP